MTQEIKQLAQPTLFIQTYQMVTRHNAKVKKQELYTQLEQLRVLMLGSRCFKNWNSFSAQKHYHTRKSNQHQSL